MNEKKRNQNVGSDSAHVQGMTDVSASAEAGIAAAKKSKYQEERVIPMAGNSLHLLFKRSTDVIGEFQLQRFPESTEDAGQQMRDVLDLERIIERLTGIRCHVTLTVGEFKPPPPVAPTLEVE